MNKNFIQIFFIVFIVFIYAKDNNSNIKAEYCLYEDTNISECSIIPSRQQLKISRFIENIDEIKLQKEKLYCFWVGTRIYIFTNNNKIHLFTSSSACMDCDIKTSLKYAFSSINPGQSYDLSYKKDFDILDSMIGKEISIMWVKIGFCDGKENSIGKEDSISGNYRIKIKGKCNEEDLLWNAKYDIREISIPIDTLDIQEVPKENDTGYNRVKMFPYESSPITSESLKRQKIHND